MFPRACRLLLLALTLSLAGLPAHAGTTYVFNGNAVNGCSLSKQTYTCPNPGTLAYDDGYTISSGYTVNVSGNVTFGYNNVLTMSGTAKLSIGGNLDISGINTPNLKVSGGTLVAGGTFSAGAVVQTFTADVQAATLNLGTGSTLNITGTMSASGTINIAANTTINGNVVGATVTTGTPVKINGDVLATTAFTLGSGGTVNGDVGAGTLTLQDSSAIINGNAVVQSATLGWAGRVTETIYCVNGTRKNQCDCVTNNSGYPVNSANGPTCAGPTTSTSVDHLLISYDAAANVCAQPAVTITACANASCSSGVGGVDVTLSPTSQTATTNSNGIATIAASYPTAGSFVLGASGPATNSGAVCKANGSSATDCKVTVAQGGFTLTAGTNNAFSAEQSSAPTLSVAALYSSNGSSAACAPLLASKTSTVTFTCAYANPTSGTLPLRLNGKALNGSASSTAACDNTGQSISLAFDATGKATTPIAYADAGQVKLTATYTASGSTAVTGNATFTVAPAKFGVQPAAPATNEKLIAGTDRKLTVTALNGAGATTPNFGNETPAQTVTPTQVACHPNATSGTIVAPRIDTGSAGTSSGVKAGVSYFTFQWPDVGTIDIKAALSGSSGNYLTSGLAPVGSTNALTSGCSGAVGPFVPAYFDIDTDTAWTRMSPASATVPQYYAGEPAIALTVSAYNALGAVTPNYAYVASSSADSFANPVTLTALAGAAAAPGYFAPAGTTSAPAPPVTIPASSFSAGAAKWTGAFFFSTFPTAPTNIGVRAADANASSANAAGYNVKNAATAEPTLLIRSGRLRLANRFGGAGQALSIPVTAEYWTGQTWVQNTDYNAAAPVKANVAVGTGLGTITPSVSAIVKGSGTITLTPASSSAAGSVYVALNLGAASATANNSCASGLPAATGAVEDYLRAVDVTCDASTRRDPSARATFGLFAPETKRIIHVREVFQ